MKILEGRAIYWTSPEVFFADDGIRRTFEIMEGLRG